MYAYTFRWTQPADSVSVTGSFNGWGQQLPMSRTTDGFELTLKLDGPVSFKFIVDGNWCCSEEYAVVEEDGIENNHVGVEELHVYEEFESQEPEFQPEMMQQSQDHQMSGVLSGDGPGETETGGTETVDGGGHDTSGSEAVDVDLSSSSSYAALSMSDSTSTLKKKTLFGKVKGLLGI